MGGRVGRRKGRGKNGRRGGGQRLNNGSPSLIRWRLISRVERGKVLESGGGSEEDLTGFKTGLEANRTCAGEQEVQREDLVQR
jgi:hypothetical protein